MKTYEIGDIAREKCSGVYRTIEEVPTFGVNPFDSQEWTEYYQEYEMANIRNIMERRGFKLGWSDAYLYTVIPVVQSKIAEKKHVSIVDIGGGQGENFLRLGSLLDKKYMEWHVIEQTKNCKLGERLKLSENVYFHDNSESSSGCLNQEAVEVLKGADICLLIGVLQYFCPYADLLKEIAATGVEYIFVARSYISSNTSTFCTRCYIAPDAGKYKDIILGDEPMYIINHQELNRNLSDLGYDVCLDLHQEDRSAYLKNLPEPYNTAEHRSILYQAREAKY